MKHFLLTLSLLGALAPAGAFGQSWAALRDSVWANRNHYARAYSFANQLVAAGLRGKAITRDTALAVSLLLRAKYRMSAWTDSTDIQVVQGINQADSLLKRWLPDTHPHRIGEYTLKGLYLALYEPTGRPDSLLRKGRNGFLALGLPRPQGYYENLIALSRLRLQLGRPAGVVEVRGWFEEAITELAHSSEIDLPLKLTLQLQLINFTNYNTAATLPERRWADSLSQILLLDAEHLDAPYLLATACEVSGIAAMYATNFARAKALHERAAQSWKALGQTQWYRIALLNAASQAQNLGQFAETARILETTLPLMKHDPRNQAILYQNLAQCLMTLPDSLDRAESYARKAYDFSEKWFGGPNNHRCVNALTALGFVAKMRFRFHEAEQYFQRAIQADQKFGTPLDMSGVQAKSNYGWLLTFLNDYEASARLFGESRKEFLTLVNPTDNPFYLDIAMGEASALLRSGRTKEGLALADSLLTTFRDSGLTSTYHQLVEIWLLATARDPTAKSDSLETWLLRQPTLPTDSSDILITVATRRLAQGRPAEAIRYFDRLLGSAAMKRSLWINTELQVQQGLAEASFASGNRQAGRRAYRAILDSLQSKAQAQLWMLTESQRHQFWTTENLESEYSLLLHNFKPGHDEVGLAYDFALSNRGLQRNVTQRIAQLLRTTPDSATRAALHQWQLARERFANGAFDAETRTKADSLSREVTRLEKALAFVLEPIRPPVEKPVGWQRVQQALKPGEAAVELLRFHPLDRRTRALTDTLRYVALVLKPGSAPPQLVPLADGTLLETTYLADYLRQVLPDSNQHLPADPDVASYNRYWKPLAAALQGVKTLYLVPDGVYHQVSLPTLFNPVSKKYLGEELRLVLLNSSRELLPAPAVAGGREAVLLGHPAYRAKRRDIALAQTGSLPNALTMTRGDSLSDLPETKIEVDELARQLAQHGIISTVKTDTAASESALKALRQPRLLHLATHGFFKPSLSHEPLLQAGLALAGAADTSDHSLFSEDGLLTAYEAQHLDLTGTELVTLSACETGRGQVRGGEGVYGLQRAFALAGAQAVLMSLWKVSDRVTQEFMAEFYRNWLGGKSKPEALRLTQQAVRRAHPEPFYWGAFVLVGK